MLRFYAVCFESDLNRLVWVFACTHVCIGGVQSIVAADTSQQTSKFSRQARVSLDEGFISHICIVFASHSAILQLPIVSSFEICFDLSNSIETPPGKCCSFSVLASCSWKPPPSQTSNRVAPRRQTLARSVGIQLVSPTSEHRFILQVLFHALSWRVPQSGVKLRNYLTHAAISMWPVTLGCWR